MRALSAVAALSGLCLAVSGCNHGDDDDTGPSCSSTTTSCGSDCCTTDQVCVNGACVLPGEPDGVWTGGPTDLPMQVAQIPSLAPDGGVDPEGVRFVVQLKIGSAAPFDAWLDTGSEGVQVLSEAVGQDVLAVINTARAETVRTLFESGIEATGVIGTAVITLGDRTTQSPIPVFLIQTLSCLDGFPCTSSDQPLKNSIFNGYAAIIGAGMRNSETTPTLGNPITQLPGNPSFIVKAPKYGGTSGVLRIGPSDSEVSSFKIMQLGKFAGSQPLSDGTPAWDDTSVPVCVADKTANASYCGNAVLDSGAPFTFIEWMNYSGPEVIPEGDDVTVSIGPQSAPIDDYDTLVSADPQPGQDLFVIIPSELGVNLINVGTPVFFNYDVYFDHPHGRIGLLPH